MRPSWQMRCQKYIQVEVVKMDTFEVFTIGNAYFLDKIFNAIRLIFSSGLTGVLKVAVTISIGLLAIKAITTSNFKETIKWVAGVIILTALFLNTKGKVVIHDQLPDSQGRVQAAYIVEDVPWGLAWIAHATSNVGQVMMKKFESAFSGVTNNQTYSKYGVLFGSKIVEDASRIRITNADLRGNMIKFYRQCMVPDLKMGRNRKNGYTFKELAQTEDMGEFLKNHSSRARSIYLNATVTTRDTKSSGFFDDLFSKPSHSKSTIDGYVSCNQAAHVLSDMIAQEVDGNKPLLSSSFTGQFMGSDVSVQAKNKFFESVLADTYGAFLKSSRDASEILKQNIMINAVTDSAKSVANSYARTATEEMTRSSMYSVSQIFQKFIPIIRSVFECLFYGVAPLVLILMVTPIGLEVLKNYAFSFLYLQMWPPMYAILYVITESWTRFSASGLKHNMQSLPQIEAINYDIAMVSGYMLLLIPFLAMFVTKGLVASVGNMATSMMYIPQTAAVNTSDQAIKGNFSMGNTSLDTHSYDNANAHKHDDNYSWMSGMKSFQTPTGSIIKETPMGNKVTDFGGSTHNLAGLANLNWNQAMGTRLDASETMAQKEMEVASKDHVESASAGMSKMLGYDSNYNKGTSSYDAINNSLTQDQREAADYSKQIVDRIAKEHGMTSNDALRMSMAAKGGFDIFGTGVIFEASGSTETQKQQAWRAAQNAIQDEKFTKSLGVVESLGKTSNIQTNDSESESAINSIRSDFAQSSSASSRVSDARENLHSIQEARSNYENNSQSVDLNLNNKFADWGVEKYGAEEFEQILAHNPEKARNAAQNFLKEAIGDVGKYKFGELSNKNLDLTGDDYSNIQSKHTQNKTTLNEYSGDFVKNSTSNKLNLQNKYLNESSEFDRSSSEAKKHIESHKNKINNDTHIHEQEAENELNQSTTQKMDSRILNFFNQGNKNEKN